MLRYVYLLTSLLVVALIAAPVSAQQSDPTSGQPEPGYVSIFNGTNLDGWTGDKGADGYAAEDGMIVCKHGGFLYTEREYADFVFRFEFRLPPGANNGIGIRTPRGENPAFAGMEIQVLDNYAEKYANLKPYQYHGAIYGVVAPKRGALKPAGQWNTQEILCNGCHVRVTLNGQIIVDADISKVTPLDGREHPGLDREKGHIAFCGHGARVEFRNLRIMPLGCDDDASE